MKRVIGIICVILFAGILVWGAMKNPLKHDSNDNTADNIDIKWEQEKGKDGEAKKVSILDYDLDEYVKLGDYKNLVVEVKFKDIDEEYVIDNINKTLERYPDYSKVQKLEVEEGDVCNIDYSGKVDGKKFDGGTAEGQHLKIGSGDFIPGFEEGLVGHRVGEEVVLNLTFPQDYQENLAGKEVEFTVKINAIEEEKILKFEDLTDKFVKDNLGFNTIDELKDYVKDYFSENAETEKTTNTRTAVVDTVVEISEVTLPKELLQSKVSEYLASLKEGIESSGSKVEDYIKQNYNQTVEEFGKDVAKMMEKSIKEQMVLYAISKKENMEPDEEGFDKYVDSFVSYYNYKDKKDLYKDYPQEELSLAYVCNMVVDYLVENSKINYVAE